jgi:hypothetical protein
MPKVTIQFSRASLHSTTERSLTLVRGCKITWSAGRMATVASGLQTPHMQTSQANRPAAVAAAGLYKQTAGRASGGAAA